MRKNVAIIVGDPVEDGASDEHLAEMGWLRDEFECTEKTCTDYKLCREPTGKYADPTQCGSNAKIPDTKLN